jgi:enoyl-CoA hydratase/carnithine racemase
MTPAEAFKLGFVARCVDAGLTGEQLEQHVKRAFDFMTPAVALVKGVGVPAAATLALAPPVVGGVAAYAKNKMLDTDTGTEVAEVQSAEQAEAYRESARRLREIYERRKRQKGPERRKVLL